MAKEVKSMFDKIKKQNGERFAKSIRNYDNGIFDIPNIDQIVKYAGKEAEPIMNYLISLKNIQIEEHGVYQSPIELLAKAGYKAYYADTLQKQNYISRYFAPGEALCTFRDRKRYQNYYIINAIKENVDQIRREDFKNPQREDEYGTSVISIQILKSGGFCSIKNRYNHTVPNPDNTFNSNPDNIIPGLSESLKHTFNVDFSSQKVRLPDNYMICGKQIVHHNYELHNTYFDEKYYVKDGKINEIDTQKELMLDYFVLNLHDKSIQNPSGTLDGFIEALTNEIKDKKLQVVVNEAKNKCLLADGVQILELNKGKIVSLNLPETEILGNHFLHSNTDLQSFNAPKLKEIGNYFVSDNKNLKEINLPQVVTLGSFFLYGNVILNNFNAPLLKRTGSHFLNSNMAMKELELPELLYFDTDFLPSNTDLYNFKAPKLEEVGSKFLYKNKALQELDLPSAMFVHSEFLASNIALQNVNLPKAIQIGSSFLSSNKKLKELILPEAVTISILSLYNNRDLEKFCAPKLKYIEDNFLEYNRKLTELYLPEAVSIGNSFLPSNTRLKNIIAPKVEKVGNDFLKYNEKLRELDLPNVLMLGDGFLSHNRQLQRLNAPQVTAIGRKFLQLNNTMKELALPEVVTVEDSFLFTNKKLQRLSTPKLNTFGEYFLYNHPFRGELKSKGSCNNSKIKALLQKIFPSNEKKENTSSPSPQRLDEDLLAKKVAALHERIYVAKKKTADTPSASNQRQSAETVAKDSNNCFPTQKVVERS